MSGQRISQFPAASSAQPGDELVANQSGTTRKVTVGQLRAGLAPASHTHGVADIVGQIPPSRLDQAGATTGQVLKWNGSAWAPAADETGTGGGSVAWSAITGIPAAIDAIDNLTPAADRIAYYTGANAAALTPLTSFARSLLDDTDAAQARATIGAAPAAHGHAASDVSDFAAATRGQVEGMLVAGANIALSYTGTGATRQATIAAVASSASYVSVTANRTLTAADNGRVLEGGASDVTLTVPAGLGKGFSCLLRRVAAGNLTATAGTGVTFAPAAGPVATTAQWDEIAIECVADSGTAATFLVRRIGG
ncbi:MAG: hypothetical protein NZ523_07035 [Elioraea sp.]|nr:hypothetical protein [Elioraea sp.]